MSPRQEIACRAAEALEHAELGALPAVLGFDGFVDDILRVVETRHSAERFDAMESLDTFGKKISAAAGHSANFELVLQQRKIGGNGPIMGNALAMLGLPVTYMGAVGDGTGGVDPVFGEFARRATLIPLTPPAHTSALEFGDGKAMLGNLRPFIDVSWERLLEVVGRERLIEMFRGAALIGLLNWTMLPHATQIWRGVAREILPPATLGGPTSNWRRVFVDLADPRKRSPADLADALAALREIEAHAAVTLGLNLAEAEQVARACDMPAAAAAHDAPVESLVNMAVAIREKVGVQSVVIHTRHGAVAASADGCAAFRAPFTEKPRISTGAGDHFNAGFALGQLLGLDLEAALCVGTAVSGFYVRRAASPKVGELATFLRALPEAC